MDKKYDERLFCSCCRTQLIKGPGLKRYENLIEHVEAPNDEPCEKEYYICPNDTCWAFGKGFWDWFGDWYTKGEYMFNNTDKFIMGKTAALGPNSTRHMNIKHDEKRITVFYTPWFKIWLVFEPIANKMADGIKDYHIKFQGLYRRNRKELSWTYYTSGIRMFLFCFRQFYHARKCYFKENKSEFWLKKMKDELYPYDWDKRWWSLSSRWILRKLYPSLAETPHE